MGESATSPGCAEAGGPVRTEVSASDNRCLVCRDALAGAVHDFKTPLTVLSGYVDLLLNSKLGALTQRQRDVLEEMSSSIEQLKRATNEFLSFSSLRFASVQLEIDKADLNACVAEVCGIWAPLFDKKGVAHYFLPGSSLPQFRFDYCKLQHVISNLLDNALKFTPGGGTVWVQVEPYTWERRVGGKQPPTLDRRKQRSVGINAARITVSDSGPGIAPEYHQEIFQEFRSISVGDVQSGGFGLGLSNARRLVELHGGKIWVESKLGAGATFYILLPFQPDERG